MLTKLFAALMTVMMCLGVVPTQTTQSEPAAPAAARTVIEATKPSSSVLLTQEEALTIALTHAQLTRDAITALQVKFELDNRCPEWEVDFRWADWEYDYTIHAESGIILEWDKEYDPAKQPVAEPPVTQPPVPTSPVTEAPAQTLTKEDAQAIALAHAQLSQQEVTHLKVKYDYDDGIPEYEVEFRVGRWEYEYEIHAETGKILSWDKDYDD